jgi:hypothetical protein
MEIHFSVLSAILWNWWQMGAQFISTSIPKHSQSKQMENKEMSRRTCLQVQEDSLLFA